MTSTVAGVLGGTREVGVIVDPDRIARVRADRPSVRAGRPNPEQ
ncbi:hypothetical protein [Embleya scabrispora]|nr:hypothetical protein [Embleya scabrispora]